MNKKLLHLSSLVVNGPADEIPNLLSTLTFDSVQKFFRCGGKGTQSYLKCRNAAFVYGIALRANIWELKSTAAALLRCLSFMAELRLPADFEEDKKH
eukprot:5477104-Pleurochrysis_carterae.AAC.1